MTTGYSKTPLIKKLGIAPNVKICILNPIENYSQRLGPLPKNITQVNTLQDSLDFIQFFTRSYSEPDNMFPQLKNSLTYQGLLWISWPKKVSKLQTDLNGNLVRELGLSHGLVDTKVCAIDENWSGLKFVYRKKDRL